MTTAAPAPAYPVNLVVQGRRCLVVGGGEVATRKVEGLVAAGADVRVVAPSVAGPIKALGVEVTERSYEPADLDGVRLVIVATDDAEANRTVFQDAEAAGIWVNAADDPEHCSFTLPAVLRRGPVSVAVGTGGLSPAMAGWLRDRLATEVGPEFEVLAGLLADERAARRNAPAPARAWHSALDSGMLELVREGRIEEAKERLQACLSSS